MPTPRRPRGLEASADEIEPLPSRRAPACWPLVDRCASLKTRTEQRHLYRNSAPRAPGCGPTQVDIRGVRDNGRGPRGEEHGGFMETSATDVEIDFDVVNLSGSANVDLDELPMNALGGSIRRVRRDTLVHRAADVSMFTSAL